MCQCTPEIKSPFCGKPGCEWPPLADTLDENHWNTLQELLNAVGALPGVMDKVDAYMRGRGIDDPVVELDALRSKAF